VRKWNIILWFLCIGLIVWTQCTSLAYWFQNTEKSQMQVFLHIPKSFVLDFSGGVEQQVPPDTAQ
jgi:hypothetical protein